eukprot:10632198-Alexandrium_andersonii.AAC.1
MSASLVGSEMCIRDRRCADCHCAASDYPLRCTALRCDAQRLSWQGPSPCLLYTSDAADDM